MLSTLRKRKFWNRFSSLFFDQMLPNFTKRRFRVSFMDLFWKKYDRRKIPFARRRREIKDASFDFATAARSLDYGTNIWRARFKNSAHNRPKNECRKRIETWFPTKSSNFLRGYRYLRAFFVSFFQMWKITKKMILGNDFLLRGFGAHRFWSQKNERAKSWPRRTTTTKSSMMVFE